jgi:hypothetical protein
MSNQCGTSGTFDLSNQAPNPAENVTLNYLPMGISGLMYNTDDNWITGLCSRSSTPNVTYTNSNNKTNNYYANKMWIVGKSNIPDASICKLHTFSGTSLNLSFTSDSQSSAANDGTSPSGELIIENFSEDGSQVLYMCFLLTYVGSNAPPGGQVDAIFNAVDTNQRQITVNLNNDIFGNVDPNATYVEYKSTQLSSGAEVLIYMNPIRIGAALVNALQNNLALIDMYNSDFTIIPLSVPGSWMECEYVPIDSEEVTSYNLPLASNILESQSNQNSIKTILTFIVFAILTGIAYAVVPDAYKFLVNLATGNNLNPQGKVNRIFRLDILLTCVIMITALTLVFVGAFANPAKVSNTGTILTAGLTMSILFVLFYIIIQSKKRDPEFLDVPTDMQPQLF